VNVPIYVVDAFTSVPFAGNPAGVCILESERESSWMQSVAAEMRHAETAYLRQLHDGYELRWFTPVVEVDLCGHATLASAHVLWESGRLSKDVEARFYTRSGLLTAKLNGQIQLDFPAKIATQANLPHPVNGLSPTWMGNNKMDWLVEVETEEEVRSFQPDFENIYALGIRGLIVTARANAEFDFVSRFFAPQSGVPEDPVTGSAHCCLAPYWSDKLGKTKMTGYQASQRGGIVGVEIQGDRVLLRGYATTILEGNLRC